MPERRRAEWLSRPLTYISGKGQRAPPEKFGGCRPFTIGTDISVTLVIGNSIYERSGEGTCIRLNLALLRPNLDRLLAKVPDLGDILRGPLLGERQKVGGPS